MHQGGRDVSLLDRRVDVLSSPAANAINEVGVVVSRAAAGGAGFGLIG